MERKDLELKLRTRLKEGFGLYEESHWVQVLEIDGNVYASYWPSWHRQESIVKSGFDFQVTDGVFYILAFNIEKNIRNRGYGSQLLKVVEDFSSAEFSVRKFQTTPSGIAKTSGFYYHRGYIPTKGVEAVKEV